MADRYLVLVTGSRTWTDQRTMRDAMAAIVAEHGPGRVTFRHGRAKGADMMCDRIARQLGAHVEQRPADWDVCAGPQCKPSHRKKRPDGSTYCPTAGLLRDREMVDDGAHEGLAFINPCADQRCREPQPHGSHGASETARMAEEAGIQVRRFPKPPIVIHRFAGDYEALSNFARIPVSVYSTLEQREITYPTSEHAFQAAKTLDPSERADILAAPGPKEAKALGGQVRRRPGWDEVIRYKAMRAIIAAKFTLDSSAGRVLLDTGNAHLIEGNTWHDQHWGDCRCGRNQCREPGQNHLGRMLMERRTELISALHHHSQEDQNRHA
ncbi:NADAR domain-containing protein [Nonomuraea sp. NPDC050202]|uniref:NADAR domain-containing protein n=1 Tax=Nonomuraea sp. NPDC050202 TaxID=3155035 RepID=UPI0033CFF70E